MAGHSDWHNFWVYHNGRYSAAKVRPTHKDTNVYYHFRSPRVALCLYLNLDLGGVGTYLTGFKGESKSVVQPRLVQHRQQLVGALSQAAAFNNDVARRHGDMYGDFSVFHEVDVSSGKNWAQMSDWFESMRQVYVGVLGSPSPSQGGGLKQW